MDAGQTTSGNDGEVARELAGVISGKLKLSSKSATLADVVASGCSYVMLDQIKREIVFDTRALYLGFLAAGLHPQKGNVGNTALWFLDWLTRKVGQVAVKAALDERADMTLAGRLLASGFTPVLSISVGALQELARSYALRTVQRPAFDARHLFAAMIERHAITEMTQRVFKVALTEGDIDDLKRDLVDQIMRSPQRGETRDAWFQTLRVKPPPSEGQAWDETAPQPPPSPDDSVSPFNGDTPIADDNDVLDTERDVEAMAQLVCLDRVTPLAVAIFGDWGSGKSTFMARLEQAVRDMPGRQAGQALPLVDEASAARFVHPIVQIRFNAWHFADANLWASLTAEFFDQLRAGGYDRSGQARHAQLVQRVNQHVHALSDTLSANRQAMAKNGQAVIEAQKARDTAAEDARKASGKVFARTAMNLLNETYVAQKRHLAALGLGGVVHEDKAASLIVGAAKDASGAFGGVRAAWTVLKASGKRWWLALPPVALVAGWALVVVWKPRLDWVDVAAPALAGAIALAVSFGKALGPTLAIVRDVAKRGAALAGEIDANNQATVAALLAKEIELGKTLAEARALEEAELASAKALARYVDPTGKANPPRLLRYVLEDDPDTKALEKDIGLIGRTRRLFQAVDTIAREVRDARREEGYAESTDADWETPERIIIYIDDLDRCHEDKVYEVLQAIHLLLAFDLFVVVVGVDVKWVQAALAKQFETGDAQADAASEQQRNERAMHYLEKIFQIPFWLRPLSSGEDGTFRPFIEMLAGESVETGRERAAAVEQARKLAEQSQVLETPVFGATTGPAGGGAKARKGAPGDAGDPFGFQGVASQIKLVEARRKLQLTQAEIAFLGSPQIAALAATAPRGVKRLVNVYRIARARRGQEDREAVLGRDERPPEYPLIALMAAVETGQRFQVAEWFYDQLKGGKDISVADLIKPKVMSPSPNILGAETEILAAAVKAAAALRNSDLVADDLLAAARLVRRYSFNRYR